MNIQKLAIDIVIPYARNPRKNETAVAKVMASLKEFGWQQPIVVDNEMVIIVGHTRLLAAKQLGMKHVPVHVANDLTPAQVKAYRLADNRSHEEAEWDKDFLALELGDLGELDFDLSLTAFDADEIKGLMALAESIEKGLTDEEACPECQSSPSA
jgi:ParB-like chromosome segregation protein Spo0J